MRKTRSPFNQLGRLFLPCLLVLACNVAPAASMKASSGAGKEGEIKVYSKPGEEELRERLTDLQWKVTQEDATERPFSNDYWDNKRPGIYVDVASG